MSARSHLNGHTAVPLPVKPAPLSDIERDAKSIVDGIVKQIGWVGVARGLEMALPRIAATIALEEGSLKHDDGLVSMLGAVDRGTQAIAAYMAMRADEIKEARKTGIVKPGVVA